MSLRRCSSTLLTALGAAAFAACGGPVEPEQGFDVAESALLDCEADTTVPHIYCGATTLSPSQLPTTLSARAEDACGVATLLITSYECYTYGKNGQKISRQDVCDVTINGPDLAVNDASIGTSIDWIVSASDTNGNGIGVICSTQIKRRKSW